LSSEVLFELVERAGPAGAVAIAGGFVGSSPSGVRNTIR
jgi:hypothetical protein